MDTDTAPTQPPEARRTEPCEAPIHLTSDEVNLAIDALASFTGTRRADEAVALLRKIERQLGWIVSGEAEPIYGDGGEA